MGRKFNEIVFFGRLESRKGLWLFCGALDRIKYQFEDVTVTFLGKMTDEMRFNRRKALAAGLVMAVRDLCAG